MIKFLQSNLNHCWATQQLLQQTVRELEIDVALISDLHSNPRDSLNWVHSDDRRCAIHVANPTLQIFESGSSAGLVWARIDGVTIVNCHSSSNCPLAEYEEFIGRLGDLIRSSRSYPVVVGGDFNTHSAE